MHPNPIFRKSNLEQNIEFIRQRSFGTLAINAQHGPLLSHIPFYLDPGGSYLEAHLLRSNPIIQMLDTQQNGVIAVAGADSYVSPDWYGIDNQVPTWNYVAIHIRGVIEKLPSEKSPEFLQRLSNQFEQRLLPKPVWTMDKVENIALEKLMKMIVPVSMSISAIEGTWKLNQNKSESARITASDELAQNGIGTQLSHLAQLMKNPPC